MDIPVHGTPASNDRNVVAPYTESIWRDARLETGLRIKNALRHSQAERPMLSGLRKIAVARASEEHGHSCPWHASLQRQECRCPLYWQVLGVPPAIRRERGRRVANTHTRGRVCSPEKNGAPRRCAPTGFSRWRVENLLKAFLDQLRSLQRTKHRSGDSKSVFKHIRCNKSIKTVIIWKLLDFIFP